jgi:heterogeneous nuclear ribonucleoprotein L
MGKPPLLEHREPLVPTPPGGGGGGGFGSPRTQQMYGDPGVGYTPRQQQQPAPRYGNPYGDYSGGASGGGGNFGSEPRVLMVYGLPGDVNCQHLFNLLCQYGNVLKVKILLNKQGTAMIEMDHPQAATSALRLLHNTPLRKGRMELGYSKHSSIMSNPNPPPLHDGTPSFVDFTGSRNNRFLTEEGSSKNHIPLILKLRDCCKYHLTSYFCLTLQYVS